MVVLKVVVLMGIVVDVGVGVVLVEVVGTVVVLMVFVGGFDGVCW